jgi:hypothetical protein
MNSTRLLLRIFRGRIVAWSIVVCVLTFLIAYSQPWDFENLPVATLLALVPLFYLRVQSHLRLWMFPASDRQAAWLTLGIAGALWAAALASVFLAQALALATGHKMFHYGNPYDIARTWREGAAWLPLALFTIVSMLRLTRLSPFFFSFLVLAVFVGATERPLADAGPVVAWLHEAWPLWLALAAFLVWEGPSHWGLVRRLHWIEQKNVPGFAWGYPDLTGPMRPTLRNDLADVVMVLPFLAAGWMISLRWSGSLLFWVMLPIAVSGFACGFYRQLRASGLGQASAVALMAARLTGVLHPLARWAGVKGGGPLAVRALRRLPIRLGGVPALRRRDRRAIAGGRRPVAGLRALAVVDRHDGPPEV